MKLLKNNLTEYHHRILHPSHLFFYDREVSKKKCVLFALFVLKASVYMLRNIQLSMPLWFLCPTPSSLLRLYRFPLSFLLFLSLPPSFLSFLFPLLLLCVCVCRGGDVLVCTLLMVYIVSLSFSVLGCWRYSFSYCILWLIFPISLYYNKICHNKSELPYSSNTKMRRTKDQESGKEKRKWKNSKRSHVTMYKPSKCKIQL